MDGRSGEHGGAQTPLFLKRVVNSDPNLPDELEKELGVMIVKCNRIYLAAVKSFGNQDFWKIKDLPEYFLRNRQTLRGQLNSLVAFLEDTSVTEYERQVKDDYGVPLPRRYTLFSVFKEKYNAWLDTNNYKRVQFNEDHYQAVFEELEIHMYHGEKVWEAPLVESTYVIGVAVDQPMDCKDPIDVSSYGSDEPTYNDGDGGGLSSLFSASRMYDKSGMAGF